MDHEINKHTEFHWLQPTKEGKESLCVENEFKKDLFFSQRQAFECPARTLFMHGTRGSGKSRNIIMLACKEIGKGWGSDYRAVIFRREYKELRELKDEAEKVIYKYFGQDHATYNISDGKWTFPSGEELFFRFGNSTADYNKFHGHQYAFIALDEITSYPNLDFYNSIKSCLRTPNPNIPRRIVLSGNPFGPNHNKLKSMFIDRALPYEIFNEGNLTFCHIPSSYLENPTVRNQEDYIESLLTDADPNKVKAWGRGSWDITSGGAIDDLFNREVHVVRPISDEFIRKYFSYKYGFDWGSSSPYSVVFIAEAKEDLYFDDRFFKRGDRVIFDEIYGAKKDGTGVDHTPEEIQNRILERVERYGEPVAAVADNQIFTKDGHELSIADQMEACNFKGAIKSRGSRVQGLVLIRTLLKGAFQDERYGVREKPGLFITENCLDWIKNVPSLPRDEKNPEDANTDAPDHDYDATRYCLMDKTYESGILTF